MSGLRLRATNATGLELNKELGAWLAMDYIGRQTGMDLPELERFGADGRSYWIALSEALHRGEKPDKLDEANAARWAKFSRKSRRKLDRQFGLGLTDPPETDVTELRAWVLHGTWPSWAELDGEPDPDTDEHPVAPDEATDRQREFEDFYGVLLDALCDHFGDEIPTIDYPLDPTASDQELARAVWVSGMELLASISLHPPIEKEDTAEVRLLRDAAEARPHLSVMAGRFLAHALVSHRISGAEAAAEISDYLDFEVPPPRPIERRALRALEQHAPLAESEASILRWAVDRVMRVGQLFDHDPVAEGIDIQGAYVARQDAYRMTASVHAIKLLLLDSYEDSQTARDNSGIPSLLGAMNLGSWRGAFERMYETLASVAPTE